MSDYLKKILFVDIETVAQKQTYEELDPTAKSLWKDQCKQSYIERNYATPPQPSDAELSLLYRNRAAIHAEFGKIVTIGFGFLRFADDGEPTLVVKTVAGTDEKPLLETFVKASEKFPILCAHNGKKFDYPYLARRLLINGIKVPPMLDVRDKKPWEIEHLDTQELWRFGDLSFPSLELLAYNLGIKFSKTIEGNELHDVFYKGEVKKIADYCASDVVALARVFAKLKNPALNINNVLHA